jgi:hypothetical protein
LIYVLTGTMPRDQQLYYRQKMDSQLPFERLLDDNAAQEKENINQAMDEIIQGGPKLSRVLNATSSSSLASSDEAYGSDKSTSGDENRGMKNNGKTESRSRSSDVRAGKFINKLRGQHFSGLLPEEFGKMKRTNSTEENKPTLNESEFFTSYMMLLKDKRLTNEEHDARCDLLSYMQTKMDVYNWKVIRQFHDQVIKYWERGLLCYDGDLETFKRHFFDGHPTKLKLNLTRRNESLVF